LSGAGLSEAAERMGLPSGWREEIIAWQEQASAVVEWLLGNRRASRRELVARLRSEPAESVLLAAILSDKKTVRETVYRYFAELLPVKPILTGKDLSELGLAPGPLFGEILDRIREARLDGLIATRHDEIDFVRKFLAHQKETAIPADSSSDN
jgi:tRNA nucleotidyltransferase (CCA-adding enzyme)